MAGSATLGSNLVDSLVPGVIDGIREALFPDLGVRQFRLYVVTRTYVGELGTSPYTDEEIEIRPQPLVEFWNTDGSLRYDLDACGVDLIGFVWAKEVSLTYTEAELVGPPADPMQQEMFFRLEDGQGQGIPDRFFRADRPPYPDREKDMGWAIRMEPISQPDPTVAAPEEP